MSSACHGSSEQRVEPIEGWFLSVRYGKKSGGDLSCIVGNAVMEVFSSEVVGFSNIFSMRRCLFLGNSMSPLSRKKVYGREFRNFLHLSPMSQGSLQVSCLSAFTPENC
jgi:hypothetical protein